MTFLEAALEILRHEGKPLHYKELTEHALGKKLLTFVGRTPEVTMQTQLTAAVKKAPGNPFVRIKPGFFGLLRYPEVSAAERAAYAKADAPRAPTAPRRPSPNEKERQAAAVAVAGVKTAGGDGAGVVGAGARASRWPAPGRPAWAPPRASKLTLIRTSRCTPPGFRLKRGPRLWQRPGCSKVTSTRPPRTRRTTSRWKMRRSAATGEAGDEATDEARGRRRSRRRRWRSRGDGRRRRSGAGTDEARAGGGDSAGGRRRRRRRRRGRGGEPGTGGGFGDGRNSRKRRRARRFRATLPR